MEFKTPSITFDGSDMMTNTRYPHQRNSQNNQLWLNLQCLGYGILNGKSDGRLFFGNGNGLTILQPSFLSELEQWK